MDFEEISDEEWSLLAPTLSIQPPGILRRGRPRIQPRVLANAILWTLTIGGSWSKLPSRYPSSPTCRSRFEEWQRDGKLDKMVCILSAVGRNFLHVPSSSYAERSTAIDRDASSIDEHGSSRVRWRSQGSWKASHERAVQDSEDSFNVNAQMRVAMEGVSLPESSPAYAIPGIAAHEQCDSSQHRPIWMGLASKGTTVTDARGYVVYVAVDMVYGAKYRGWTEIMRDGKRIGRSGLVGPRFCAPEAGMQFALAWARRWIELHANYDDQRRTPPDANTDDDLIGRPAPQNRDVLTQIATEPRSDSGPPRGEKSGSNA